MKQNIVFVKGNADRAGRKENGNKSATLKIFNKRIEQFLKTIGSPKSVSSRNFKEVPNANIYIGHSRGCGRMNKFGSDDSMKICLDDYQDTKAMDNTLAAEPNHYKISDANLEKIRKLIKTYKIEER